MAQALQFASYGGVDVQASGNLRDRLGTRNGDVVLAHWFGTRQAAEDRFDWMSTWNMRQGCVCAAMSEPSSSPRHERKRHVIEIAALFGESVLVSRGPVLILDSHEKACIDKPTHPIRQDVGSDAQTPSEIIESLCAEEAFADDETGPAVTEYRQRAGYRAWSPALDDMRRKVACDVLAGWWIGCFKG